MFKITYAISNGSRIRFPIHTIHQKEINEMERTIKRILNIIRRSSFWFFDGHSNSHLLIGREKDTCLFNRKILSCSLCRCREIRNWIVRNRKREFRSSRVSIKEMLEQTRRVLLTIYMIYEKKAILIRCFFPTRVINGRAPSSRTKGRKASR